ncbi:MAG: CRISPR-associated endonuclease Cas2 [Chloroflexi bacterium]|nr:CRISPR-associated endonuclease Cas2 [Chloroflexota bacterium]
MLWVISYDVTDAKRRSKISKLLEGYGRRAQYSVFECDIDDQKCAILAKRLEREIDPAEDDIRFYPLNGADLQRVRVLGKAEIQYKKGFYIT